MRKTSKIEKKIKKKKIGLIIVILFFLLSIFFVLFTKTDFFNVTAIEVINNNKLNNDEIIMASGLVKGENIFIINISDLENNLTKLPYIKEVDIKRSLPNKIIMNIKERTDFMIISYIGSFLYLDNEGVLINISITRENKNIPIINGLQINNPQLGDKLLLNDDENIDDIVNFLKLSNVVGLYDEINEIEFINNKDINFRLETGTTVAFGGLNNVKYKLRFVVEIINKLYESGDLNEDNASRGFIDLTQGEDAVFTLKE